MSKYPRWQEKISCAVKINFGTVCITQQWSILTGHADGFDDCRWNFQDYDTSTEYNNIIRKSYDVRWPSVYMHPLMLLGWVFDSQIRKYVRSSWLVLGLHAMSRATLQSAKVSRIRFCSICRQHIGCGLSLSIQRVTYCWMYSRVSISLLRYKCLTPTWSCHLIR